MAFQEKLDFAWHLIMQRMLESPQDSLPLTMVDEEEIRLNSESSEQLVIANIPTSDYPMLEDEYPEL